MVSYTIAIVAIFSIMINFTFLILLVRWKNSGFGIFSSLYIMTTSDTLCDMVLPIILLIDQFHISNYYQFHYENISENITDTGCNFGSVLWYYTLFLVSLFNTFIPLLSKSLHCLYHMKCIETKCDEFMFEQSNIISLKQTNMTLGSSRLNKYKHNLTIFCIMCQWILLPILIAILYIAERNKSDPSTQLYNSISCMYMMDLPLNNCYNEVNDNAAEIKLSEANIDDTNTSLSNIRNDYMMNYDSNESLSLLTDKIISRLHDIVESVRNISELMITQSSIHCLSQLANNRMIMKPEASTYNEPVKPNKDTNLLIQDQLYKYIGIMDINENIVPYERYPYDNCFESRYIIPVRLFFPILIVYLVSICLSIISYVKCRHILLSIIGKSKATYQMKAMTSIKITQGITESDRSSNSELVIDRYNGVQYNDKHLNHKERQFQYKRNQTDVTEKLILTFWTTIILAVVLWTPLLLHILAQMIFCYRIPNWLTGISYSTAMSSSIIRNILSIFMIKMITFSLTIQMKHNKIHPIST